MYMPISVYIEPNVTAGVSSIQNSVHYIPKQYYISVLVISPKFYLPYGNAL